MAFGFGGWATDLRHAARGLRRAKGFTITAVGTLALAIGVTAGMFAVVDKVLLEPLPFPEQERLVYLAGRAPGTDLPAEGVGLAAEFFVHYKEHSKLLADIGTVNSFTTTMKAGDRVERVRMSAPPASTFSTLGVAPLHGRLPNAQDNDRVAVLSHAMFVSWFASDPAVVGKAFSIAGEMRTVIGVMPREFRIPDDGTLLWFNSPIRAEGLRPGNFGGQVIARMTSGTTREAVAAELTGLAKALPARFGGSGAYARIIEKFQVTVTPLDEELLEQVARPLWILFGALAVVLLIACANVANLFLVRADAHQRDYAVRRAVGAGGAHLIRLQMAEAIIVSTLAAVLALAFAYATLPAFLAAAPAGLPRAADIAIDMTSIAFTIGTSIVVALICGLGPAFRAAAAPFARLRDGGRGATRRRNLGRDVLVVGQTALALVLLIGAGLLLRSFWALKDVDAGYDTENIFSFQIAPDRPSLRTGPAFAEFDQMFMERLRALPGVESVGLVENIPLDEGVSRVRMRGEGTTGEADSGPLIGVTFSAGDYFKTMGIAMLAGRQFDTRDHAGLPNVIVSRAAAQALWGAADPMGKRLQSANMPDWFTVVGVVEDVRQYEFGTPPEPLIYLPLVGPNPQAWIIASPAFVIKTPRAEEIAADVRALVREVAPEAPMYRAYTMDFLARRSLVRLSFTLMALGVAASLALILGAVGLYGVLSCVVTERRPEIGVRLALGAQVAQVRRMVVLQGTRVVLLGVAAGLLAAFLVSGTLGNLLFGIEAVDTVTFISMAVLMLAIGMLASYVPARRASAISPLESLRGN